MNLEYNKGILFVRLNGNLDRSISKVINTCLVPKILEQKIKYLVFNFYEVLSVDEYALDAILNVKCAIKANKGKICLCEISDSLSKYIKNFSIKKVENELKALNIIGAM